MRKNGEGFVVDFVCAKCRCIGILHNLIDICRKASAGFGLHVDRVPVAYQHVCASVEVQWWSELQDQIKKDLRRGYKTLPLSRINQLLIIHNFVTLHLKGLNCIPASLEIARQWHEGPGAHFAHCVCALARHYQVFEQLLVEK
jgi:hypothetical protein